MFLVDMILQLGVSIEAFTAVFAFKEVRCPEMFEKRTPAFENFAAQVTEERSLGLDVNVPTGLTSLGISISVSEGPVLEVLQY